MTEHTPRENTAQPLPDTALGETTHAAAQAIKSLIPQDVDPGALETDQKTLLNIAAVLERSAKLHQQVQAGTPHVLTDIDLAALAIGAEVLPIIKGKLDKAITAQPISPEAQHALAETVDAGLDSLVQFNQAHAQKIFADASLAPVQSVRSK